MGKNKFKPRPDAGSGDAPRAAAPPHESGSKVSRAKKHKQGAPRPQQGVQEQGSAQEQRQAKQQQRPAPPPAAAAAAANGKQGKKKRRRDEGADTGAAKPAAAPKQHQQQPQQAPAAAAGPSKKKAKRQRRQAESDAINQAPAVGALAQQRQEQWRQAQEKQQKREKQERREQREQQPPAAPAPPRAAAAPPPPTLASSGKKGKKGGSVLDAMRQRLQGGRFRWLNEALYTSGGDEALAMVQGEPALMRQYHEGFREQTRGWPAQPVDLAIRWLKSKPASWVVADLGCGDAQVAATAQQRVHSFDLAVTAPGVVACNMAALPLGPATVDAALFSLSLMGTDYGSFLEEAARVLKPDGWLWIAEVQSRFMKDGGGGGGGEGASSKSVLHTFIGALGTLGFRLRRRDTSNTHFLVLELQREPGYSGGGGKSGGKQAAAGARPAWPPLRACQYKKR